MLLQGCTIIECDLRQLHNGASCLLTKLLTYARMKQRDAVTRRESRRHATNIVDERTQQQQQQQHPVNQQSSTAFVMTRQRKRRREETNDQKHLVESKTQTRRMKKQTQTGLHSQITTNNQLMSGDERPEEQLVETGARTQSMKESKQTSPQTDKTTESQAKCEKEKNEQLVEAKNRIKRTSKSRKTSFSIKSNSADEVISKLDKERADTRQLNRKTRKRRKTSCQTEHVADMSGSDKQADQQSETSTHARKSKDSQHTDSDAKNTREIQMMSGSKQSEQQTGTRIRGDKEPKQTSFEIDSGAEDQLSVGPVAGKTCRTTTKTVFSRNGHESDTVAQGTPRSDAADVTKSTSVDVAKQTRRSRKSTSSRKPQSQTRRSRKSTSSQKPQSRPGPPSASLQCSLNLTDSADKTSKDQASSKDIEVDDETKWHNERRANLPRSIDDAAILAVTCGRSEAELVLNRLESGSRGACVRQSDGSWLTPNEFQLISGRGNAKDWKRSIRHHGLSLKSLVEQGLLSLASPPLCICQHCDVQVSRCRFNSLLHRLLTCSTRHYRTLYCFKANTFYASAASLDWHNVFDLSVCPSVSKLRTRYFENE